MRSLAILAALSLSAIGLAQSPLTTVFTGTNQGNVGGAVFFDLTINTTVTLTQFDINCGQQLVNGVLTPAIGTAGTLSVWLGPATWVGATSNVALWAQVASAPVITAAPGSPTAAVLTQPFALGPGTYAVGLVSQAYMNRYTTGALAASTAEMSVQAGGAQNVPWTATTFTPRGFNGSIYYTLGGTPLAVASQQPYGVGCYDFAQSFYEYFPNATLGFDLGGTATTPVSLRMTMDPSGSGYLVGPGSNQWFTHTAAGVLLPLGDNTFVTQAVQVPILYPQNGAVQLTTSIEICDNGYISPGASNPPANPAAATVVSSWLGGAPRWGLWFNFDPSVTVAPDGIYFEEDLATLTSYVTWQAVATQGFTGVNTWQVAFLPGGVVELRFGVMSLNGGGNRPALMGWTTGGGARDAGNMDLRSTAGNIAVFTTEPMDNAPLRIDTSTRPLVGTTMQLQTSDIPSGTAVGAYILSLTQFNPGIPLGPIGMPDCFQYVGIGAAAGGVSLLYFPTGSTHIQPWPIPNNNALNGVIVYAQSGAFSSGFNPLGVIASQGLRLQVGSL